MPTPFVVVGCCDGHRRPGRPSAWARHSHQASTHANRCLQTPPSRRAGAGASHLHKGRPGYAHPVHSLIHRCGHRLEGDAWQDSARAKSWRTNDTTLWTTASMSRWICHRVGVTSGFAPLAGYVLNPAARVLWRSPSCIQLELGRRAVMLEGIDAAAIRALTGQAQASKPLSPPGHAQKKKPLPPPAAKPFESAVGPLAAAGFLIRPNPDAPSIAVPRLAADLAALRVRHGHQAEQILAARRTSFVVLRGTGRTLTVVGALLAAAGVGHVAVHAEGDAVLE